MHNTYTGVSKVDMSEDIEPVLSKIDVVLTFAIEVSYRVFTRSSKRPALARLF